MKKLFNDLRHFTSRWSKYAKGGGIGLITLALAVVMLAGNVWAYSPLEEANTSAAFATHRTEDTPAWIDLLRMRQDPAGTTITVWDIDNYTSNYKTSADGEWIDGSAYTNYMIAWYDQTGYGKHVTQTTVALQPKLVFNVRNGRAAVYFPGDAVRYLQGQVSSVYVTNAYSSILSGVEYEGVSKTATNSYGLPGIFMDSQGYFGLHHGIYGSTWGLHAYNWDTNEDVASWTSLALSTWYAVCWRKTGTAVNIYINGASAASASTGNTSSLAYSFIIGSNVSGMPMTGYIDQIYIYSNSITTTQITNISNYILTPPPTPTATPTPIPAPSGLKPKGKFFPNSWEWWK